MNHQIPENWNSMWGQDLHKYVLIKRARSEGVTRYGIFERGEKPVVVLIDDDDLSEKIVQRMLDAGVAVVSDFNEALDCGYFGRL